MTGKGWPRKKAGAHAKVAHARVRPAAPAARRPAPAPFTFAAGLERTIKESPALERRVRALAEAVTFHVAAKTVSGRPIQQARGTLSNENFRDYRPREDARDAAVARLQSLGFEVLHVGRFGITARGPAELVKGTLGTELVVEARARRPPLASLLAFDAVPPPPAASDLFVVPRESLTVASAVSEAIDHFVFTPPPILFAPSATPPALAYAHLATADIRRLLNVPDGAETGQGVRVAVVDTGFYPHPYYAANGFAVRSVLPAGESDVDKDGHGHGTAVPLNLLAVAPGADLVVVKNSRGQADVAIEKAVDEGARILSCSWGWNYEQMFPILEATLRSVIADDGVIVLFAAGNGQYAWPASMPEVISVGGVYADPANAFALEASSYASGFMSGLYPPRRVPDFSGLCGQAPRGIYIPMPCPPGSEIDSLFGGGGFPEGDETAKNDGWVVASGTSSATPQVAGVVALMLERAQAGGGTLTTATARAALEQTARAVNAGRNAMGFPAVGQPNVACGFGLVDASAAIARV